MAYRALFTESGALLTECRALLTECRTVLVQQNIISGSFGTVYRI